ncbi:hypothetical protein [Actinomadura rupiterrae]|uniref:hypothetical protein n=1 Tax=Actinomadura rupiterrae TaxID=559627 RepID=UPI0020A46BB3|nr:hypothetical protein [Actinomadura rupiterrae]MCP2343037.1 hypothetical protein [Actinomadura rupiterrae]
MRFQNDDNPPFTKALAKKKSKRDFQNPRAGAMANHANRNARRLPTRQLNRGR